MDGGKLDRLTLVLGGARSGKSRYAEGLVTALPPPWTYVATAQVFDAEMRVRVDAHRAGRAAGWTTVEEPLELVAALAVGGPVLCVLVSNEVGLGIVPDNALARRFRDAAGVLHQRLAAKADRVVFMVAGLPLEVK
jgi:adenosyl cobinamide kinase/adenosyl cobinamide phosphate guanylyltransferase